MKRHVIILLITLFVAAVVFYLLNKYKPMETIQEAFKNALNSFSPDIVRNAERIFRLESNHFKSGQYKGTLSPGMEKFSDSYPYGWKTLDKIFWSKNPKYKPTGLKTYTENGTGIKKTFIQFPNLTASVMTLCAFLQYYGNNPGRWFSLNPDSQNRYNESIKKITPTYTNEQLV